MMKITTKRGGSPKCIKGEDFCTAPFNVLKDDKDVRVMAIMLTNVYYGVKTERTSAEIIKTKTL